jgi:hypothetical protein
MMIMEEAMSRRFFYLLIAISIVASVLIAANKFEKKEVVYITPGSGEVTIGPKQMAVARMGWAACSRGLVQDWIDHAVLQLELYKDNTLLQTVSTQQGKWTAITDWVNPNPPPLEQCVHVNEPKVVYWYFEDLQLKEPGVYNLRFYREHTVPLGDGWDYDYDGQMDIFSAGVEADRVVIINVLAK